MNTMLRPTLLLGLGAALLAVPAARAQNLYTLQYDHPTVPASYVTGDARDVALGQFTDDAIPDACVLHGNEAFLIRAVDRRSHWRKLSGTYTDLERLPQGQPNGRDDVLAIAPTGLVALEWNGAPGIETLVPRSLSGTSGWSAATHLRVATSPSGSIEIIGLGSSGRSILRAKYAVGSGTVVNLSTIWLSVVATDLTAIDYDAGSDLEYAYAGNWGVRICNPAGTSVASINETCNRSLLVRVEVENEYDRLAWVRAPSGTADLLTVLLPGGAVDPAIYLYGASIARMALFDLGDDPRPELLLFADGLTFTLGLRRAAVKTFLGHPTQQFGIDLDRGHTLVGDHDNYPFVAGTGVVGGANLAPVPAVMDLDGDGDDDLFLAGHPNGSARAMVYLGEPVREEAAEDPATNLRAWIPGFQATLTQTPDQFELNPALASLPTSGPATEATHLRYTVWTQAQGAPSIDFASELVYEIDLTQPGVPQAPSFLIANASSLGAGWVHIEASFLKRDPGGAMAAAFPAYHEKLALSWFTYGVTLDFEANSAGYWAPPYGTTLNDGGVGGTSGRPPITPPSGGGG